MTPHIPSARDPVIFYSNQSRQDIKLLFCSALKSAAKSIHISVYGITDQEIIDLMKDRSVHGIKTVVTYDKHASSGLLHKLPRTLTAYAGGSSGLMHRKILVIDEKLVFLGSANLTTTSLKYHDNLVIGFFSPELARYLISLQKPPEKKKRKNRKNPLPPKEHFPFTAGPLTGELWLLPDNAHESETRVLKCIQTAQKTIKIAMFTLTHPLITEALINAKDRGVSVEVIIDYYTARGASQKMVSRMQEAGFFLRMSRGQQLLHHKWALIDDTTLLMGSANWTKAAFEKNEDFILFLPHLPKDHQQFMHSLWKKIKAESFILED